jgi:hypothetical protein
MSLFSKIKGLSYEMEEYLYELKDMSIKNNPERMGFLIVKYKEDLIELLKLTSGDLKGLSVPQKTEVLEIKLKYDAVCENLKELESKRALKTSKGKEAPLPHSEKINKHPAHVEELAKSIQKNKKLKKDFYYITDDSVFSDFFSDESEMKVLASLEKKYNLKKIKLTDKLWKIVENMHKFRPF